MHTKNKLKKDKRNNSNSPNNNNNNSTIDISRNIDKFDNGR